VATVSCGGKKERFKFIHLNKNVGVVKLCDWLKVSPSGYYAWRNRVVSERVIDDAVLTQKIKTIHSQSDGIYGSPRVHAALQKQGIKVARKRVERLMREAGLKGRLVLVTSKQPKIKSFFFSKSNLLLNASKPEKIDQIWVADVTYLKVAGKWQYLATVMDQYSRRIIGWSLGATRSSVLTSNALTYAMKKRSYPKNVILHTDRGSEYLSYAFQTYVKKWRMKHSVNRPGHCTDNAFMESFFHSLKAELIRGRKFDSIIELRKAVSDYINNFYNNDRLHSGLNYCSPIEFEAMAA